jgi:hypothetical protein
MLAGYCRDPPIPMHSGKLFAATQRLDHDNYVVRSFGDSPEMATELADLVIAGIKRPQQAWRAITIVI